MTITEIETRAKAAGRTIASILILAGVSRATFWRWKTGKFQPRASSIARIRSIILSLEKP
jgi:predicted transcriptional regulator